MKFKKFEFGRSMVEMILVIAILSLLIIGGLYSLRKAYTKIQVKSVTERLLSLKNQRNLSSKKEAGRHIFTDKDGPFGSELIIENGIGEQNRDYFWITIKKNSASFCDEMLKADVGAVKIEGDNCPEETTFYFLKNSEGGLTVGDPDKTKQPTIECPTGLIIDDECKPCDVSNATCQDGEIICNSGYYRVGNICKTCQQIDSHATQCDENGHSTKCQSGYFVSENKCKACLGHPTCSGGELTCDDGWYLSESECKECPSEGNPITVSTSGICSNLCPNSIETPVGNGTYICSYCLSTSICNTQCCGERYTCDTNTTSATYNSCICSTSYPVLDYNNVCQPCPTTGNSVIVSNSGDCKNKCPNTIEIENTDETYICIPSCPEETPLWNGTQCVACPTNGGSVILQNTGLCLSVCLGIEEENGNGTYTCKDSSGVCQTAMENAGFKKCDTTTTTQCFTVSGNNVVWVHKDNYVMNLSSSNELDMPTCNLTVNTEADINGNMSVHNLTINNSNTSSNYYGLKASQKNKTINVGGDLNVYTTKLYAIYLGENNVNLNITGNVHTESESSRALSTINKSFINVDGTFYAKGSLAVQIGGGADFAQDVTIDGLGGQTGLNLTPYDSTNLINFHGDVNVITDAGSGSRGITISSNADINFDGNVTVEATNTANNSNGAFEINSIAFYGDMHTITIGGNLQSVGYGHGRGIHVVKAYLNVGGDVVGICKGGSNATTEQNVGIYLASGTITSQSGKIVGKTGYKYGIYMQGDSKYYATWNADKGIYYNGEIYQGSNYYYSINGNLYNSIPSPYNLL